MENHIFWSEIGSGFLRTVRWHTPTPNFGDYSHPSTPSLGGGGGGGDALAEDLSVANLKKLKNVCVLVLLVNFHTAYD